MSELKPCPFCGGKAETTRCWTGHYQVWCTQCAAVQMGSFYDSEAEAIEAWNKRAGEQK